MKTSVSGMLIFLFLFCSCSNEIDASFNNEKEIKKEEFLKTTEADVRLFVDKVSASISNLSVKNKKHYNLRNSFEESIQSSFGGDIESLEPIFQDNEPICWAVNFTNDNGFLLLSANKIDFPILGFSEKGKFSLSFSEIDYIKEQCPSVSVNLNDTVNNENYKFWRELLSCEEDEEIEVEFVSENFAVSDENNQLRIVSSMPDRKEAKNRESMYQLGYNLQWRMSFPYNYGIKKGRSVSEVALALGHFMYINKYPYKYNWLYMPPGLVSNENKETLVSALLKELTEDLGSWYYEGDPLNISYVDRSKVTSIPKLLEDKYDYAYGGDLMLYTNDEESFVKVYNELLNYKPVLFFYHYNGSLGSNSPAANRMLMSWVVDGYQEVYMKYTKKKQFLGITIITKTWYLYKDFFHRIGPTTSTTGWYDQEYASLGMKPDEHDYQMVMCKKYALINVEKEK